MFEQTRASGVAAGSMRPYPTEIKALTSFRFFAAFWVVLYHLVWGLPDGSSIHYAFISEGYVAVDFFFILSGFILCHAHRDQLAQHDLPGWTFISKRLARIYPMHFVTLLFYLAIFVSTILTGKAAPHPERYSLTQFFLNLFLLHAWQIHDTAAFNFPSWSVSAEWFAYLLFPLLSYLMFSRRGKYPATVILIGAVAYFLLTWFLCPILLGSYLGNMHSGFGILRVLPEFMLGMALYNFSTCVRPAFLGQSWVVPVLFLVILGFAALQLDMVFSTLAFGVLIVAAAETSCRGQSGLLASSFLLYLGEISYSVYMVHQPVATVINQGCAMLHHPVTPLIVAATALVILPVAALSHRYIEVPGRRLVRRLLGDRPIINLPPRIAGSSPIRSRDDPESSAGSG